MQVSTVRQKDYVLCELNMDGKPAILLQLYQEAVEEKNNGIRSRSTDLPGS